jgi:FkbM family methyltransferase
MECGEFDKRNKDYFQNYSKDSYFRKLLENKQKNQDLLINEDQVIFDVGAHGGESAKFFNQIFPQASIFSFEPIPKMVDKIRELKLENHKIEECALSNFNGTQNFHIQDISHLSSLHKVNKSSKESLGYHTKESHVIVEVEVKRGDSYIEQKKIPHINLLKIDVQANEVQTLEGFSGFIHKINAVLVEVSFYDFYENKSSIKLIEEQLPNFELYDIFEISKNPKTLGTDWATIVYKNKVTNL